MIITDHAAEMDALHIMLALLALVASFAPLIAALELVG